MTVPAALEARTRERLDQLDDMLAQLDLYEAWPPFIRSNRHPPAVPSRATLEALRAGCQETLERLKDARELGSGRRS